MTARHSTDLLVAFRRDATKRRYASWDELYDYCRYSAMPVGRHVLDLHGEDAATHAPSDALCTSLQVLNHLQDCAKDLAALDRCYLPEDWLAEAGSSVARGARGGRDAGVAAACSTGCSTRGRAERGRRICRAARATGGCGSRRR